MGAIRKHLPVKLFVGFIFKEQAVFEKAKDILTGRFGKIDYESQIIPFSHTDYYEAEFGKTLSRKFIAFERLILPENLSKTKITANTIEEKLSVRKRRLVNIDPGYVDMARVVLASTKDYRHRIYLNKGIYAEITLFYQDKSFAAWEWTYPDYKSPDYISIFNAVREIYAGQIKNR